MFKSYFLCNIQIDEKTWISREIDELNNDQYRDIRVDYPGIDDVVHEEELGYRNGLYIQLKIALNSFVHFLFRFDFAFICQHILDIHYNILGNTSIFLTRFSPTN